MVEFRFLHQPMPHAALFLAAKAFVVYHRNGWTRDKSPQRLNL
ncbi:MAG: hypothetical protein WCT14_12800 [Treponemataceae bacterium]